MKIKILGSAAGGGFPQWNCNCSNCKCLRSRELRSTARTQSSIAVCGDDEAHWALINVSPDILAQLRQSPELHPQGTPRHSPLRAVILTDSQIDHVTGLLMLREASTPLQLWCNDETFSDLTTSLPIISVLQKYCGVERRTIERDVAFTLPGLSPLEFCAIPIAGKSPPYSDKRTSSHSFALRILDTKSGATVVYAPALAKIEPPIWQALFDSHCALIDGTFWTDNELGRHRISNRTAGEMGHLPLSGAGGLLEWFAKMPQSARKILVHINNTNPILNEDSMEYGLLRNRGVEVAHDGMEIVL